MPPAPQALVEALKAERRRLAAEKRQLTKTIKAQKAKAKRMMNTASQCTDEMLLEVLRHRGGSVGSTNSGAGSSTDGQPAAQPAAQP